MYYPTVPVQPERDLHKCNTIFH